VKLEQDGKTIYESALSAPDSKWRSRNGTWSFRDGAYAQTTQDWNCWTFMGDNYRDVTLSLKARKLSGGEGFVISVGNVEGRRVEFTVGGWENRQHTIEAEGLVKGTPGTVETGRWYDVKVTTRGATYPPTSMAKRSST